MCLSICHTCVNPAPHPEQRCISKQWSIDDLVVEYAPFQFELLNKKGAREIRPAPWHYIDNLPKMLYLYWEICMGNRVLI